LLEMTVDLELESNTFLKCTTLRSMIINPDDDDEGNWKPCDIFQE
jgi:hypothetical protein